MFNIPEPNHKNPFFRVKPTLLLISNWSKEYELLPVKNKTNPVATPNTPICHSSRQVVPIHPDPSKIPIAKKKTPMDINRVNKPNMSSRPTTASTIRSEEHTSELQ